MVPPSKGDSRMRSRSLLFVLGLASAAPLRAQTQRFADLHRSLPWDRDDSVALALGDVDGDGDLDLLLGNTGSYPGGQSRLYLNEGSGVFADATSTLLVNIFGGARALALGDVDGDGDLDALLGNFGPPCALLLNNGSGGFASATVQLPSLDGPTRAVALSDVDSDGDLDALIGNDTQQNRLYENNGAGFFVDATWRLPAVFIRTYALAVGDVDGDGDLDFLVGNGQPGPFSFNRLHLNDGTGFFTDETGQIPLVSAATRAVALGDVDGDGDLDALLGNDLASQSLLHLNDGTGVFTDATSQLPAILANTAALAVGDVDGDGDLDALLGNDGQSRLYVNNGSGAFADAVSQLPLTLETARSLAFGDVDGDGDLDAVIGNGGTRNRLHLNDGAGTFTDATSPPPLDAEATQALALGDLDGDGDLDALLGNDGQSRLFLNAGTGLFAHATSQLPAFADDTCAVALGDVDGDGDLDALLGNHSGLNPNVGAPERLYLNNGSGTFSNAPTQLPSNSDFTYAVALGDVDGDGDLDALIGNSPYSSRLYLNDGAGVYSNATNQLGGGSYARALALGDVDGDGDLDALFGTTLSLNDGTGLFTNPTNLLPGSFGGASALAFGDADEDGDLDLLIGRYAPPGASTQNRFLRNGGAGAFIDATSELPARLHQTLALALGDVDGDGDLDAVFGNFEEASRLPVFNLTRQLAWRGIPRVGKPLTFDIRGPAWGAWFLVASLGTGNTPLPPLGVIRLDLATLIPQVGGLLDAQGQAAVTYQAPAVPALVGQSLYWQAVVVGPARLTNLEVTTFTNL
jgi:VCBS repeat protein